MNADLLFYLIGYIAIKEEIKGLKSPYQVIKFSLKRKEILKNILSLIDDEVLSFKELYKLLKMYEERKNKSISFQTHRLELNEQYYEESALIDYICVEKNLVYGKKETKYVLIQPLYSKFVTTDPIKSKPICSDLIQTSDVSYILMELKCLKHDYNSFLNLVISYLIKKYM